MNTTSIFDTLVVVKRSGQRTSFTGEKIALAIKKAFDHVETNYNQVNVNQVYSKVLFTIEKDYQGRKTIKIEDIQDVIEEQLKKLHYMKEYEAFSTYREQRAASRETFVVKQQHKFLKAMESLGLDNFYDREGFKNSFIMKQSSYEILRNFGTTVSTEFAKAYLLDNKYVRAHDSGLFHIDHIEYMPMGTVATIQIELDRLFKNGFVIDEQMFFEPRDIMEAVHQTYLILNQVGKDQYQTPGIGAIDYYLAGSVLKTFQAKWAHQLEVMITTMGFLPFVSIDKIFKEIDKLESIDQSIDQFQFAYKDSSPLKHVFEVSYELALKETKELTYQAIQYLFESMITLNHAEVNERICPSISFGTDCSFEGRIVILAILEILSTFKKLKKPSCFMKLKRGINFKEGDPNYDLLEFACELVQTGHTIQFSFLDVSYNSSFYHKGNYKTEVQYMLDGIRVSDDITGTDNQVSGGKGSLASITLNIPRLALRHGIHLPDFTKPDLEGFYQELSETMDLAKEQMLERFEIQCSRHNYNFPILVEQGIWLDGEKVKETDRLRKLFKHGTLEIRFVGLAEALKALLGKNHREDKEVLKIGQKIVKLMRKKVDEYSISNNLNFTLSGVNDVLVRQQFCQIDQAIYGKIKGVTDQKMYTESFHVPGKTIMKLPQKLELEAGFHAYTNGGHMFSIVLPSLTVDSLINSLILMEKSKVGCVEVIGAKVDS